MKKHRFQWLVDRDGDRVQIDADVVPLIRRIWDIGLATNNSCQDNFGYVWVEFDTATDASAFLSIIAHHGSADLRYRAKNPCDVSPHDAANVLVNDYGTFADMWLIAASAFGIDGCDDVSIGISIRFPRDHLGGVMDALELATPAADH